MRRRFASGILLEKSRRGQAAGRADTQAFLPIQLAFSRPLATCLGGQRAAFLLR
ncbi:MAG: hypothetical protein IJJ26_08055 [Victivallales bacterium]|nr:hypothetical protein [Victivallales bacterium]